MWVGCFAGFSAKQAPLLAFGTSKVELLQVETVRRFAKSASEQLLSLLEVQTLCALHTVYLQALCSLKASARMRHLCVPQVTPVVMELDE